MTVTSNHIQAPKPCSSLHRAPESSAPTAIYQTPVSFMFFLALFMFGLQL
jgi:hypothetical protein